MSRDDCIIGVVSGIQVYVYCSDDCNIGVVGEIQVYV